MAMPGLLADINIQGQVRILQRLLEGQEWHELRTSLSLPILTFADVGLARDASDAAIWHLCQEQGLFLITANRNRHGPDSLEATIRAYNSPTALPTFTVARPDQVRRRSDYAGRVC